MDKTYDFGGWATKINIECSDGRTIMDNAFAQNDGKKVPIVWNHNHQAPEQVLGHGVLENRPGEGMYMYGWLNDTEHGQLAKQLIIHRDIDGLSIFANQLSQENRKVKHGNIREVSLVLAGANPLALIDDVVEHADNDESAIFYNGKIDVIAHADDDTNTDASEPADTKKGDSSSEKDKKEEKTIGEVLETLSDEQMKAVLSLVAAIKEEDNDSDGAAETKKEEKKNNESEGGSKEMKHNVFENDEQQNEQMLSHDAMDAIVKDIKRYGSMKESVLAHADDYGIKDIEYLFPEAQMLNEVPEFIKRDTGWVENVMSSVHKSPFSRIKSILADITEDEARAKGYIKGKLKKDEVFALLKRTTQPTTVYKKQKFDRDDLLDITTFDKVAWIKSEMRLMLDEEIARAVLISDGRLSSSDDKIDVNCIRPIAFDDDLYAIHKKVVVPANATSDDIAKATIRATIKARKDYKGSGSLTFYTTEDTLTDMLLLEDTQGRRLYNTEADLAAALRVKTIVTVPPMEDTTGKEGGKLLGIAVNLNDYNIGADKGGEVNMFDDFDIDYNRQKYLIETRCSGALTKPKSAIVLELEENIG